MWTSCWAGLWRTWFPASLNRNPWTTTRRPCDWSRKLQVWWQERLHFTTSCNKGKCAHHFIALDRFGPWLSQKLKLPTNQAWDSRLGRRRSGRAILGSTSWSTNERKVKSQSSQNKQEKKNSRRFQVRRSLRRTALGVWCLVGSTADRTSRTTGGRIFWKSNEHARFFKPRRSSQTQCSSLSHIHTSKTGAAVNKTLNDTK